MGKVFVRIDDRLIHGQTIVAWAPLYQIKEIIAIDDVSAKNPALKAIMTMGVSKNYKTNIVTTQEAKALLASGSNDNRLLIAKYPHILQEVKDEIKGCESIVLGNMAKREDTNHQMSGATGIFYMSDQDIEELNSLVNEGFKVMFQQLPTTPCIDFETYYKTI